MNIFYLDHDPRLCAQAHVDKHVGKMILESAQLMSTAHRELDSAWQNDCYKSTHIMHPSAIWVREARDNYGWLFRLYTELNTEFSHRYDKWHGSYVDLSPVLRHNPVNTPGATPVRLAMDTRFILSDDPILNYRNYYRLAKRHLHNWTRRKPPIWLTEED